MFPSGIGDRSAVEHEAAAISGFVFRRGAPMKRKAENSHDQRFGFSRSARQFRRFGVSREALQFFRAQHAGKCFHQRGQRDGQLHVVQQPAQVFQRVRHALQKMGLTLIETAETVSPQGLHNTHINVGVVVPHEGFAVQRDEVSELVEIVIEQFLAQLWRQISLRVIQ